MIKRKNYSELTSRVVCGTGCHVYI